MSFLGLNYNNRGFRHFLYMTRYKINTLLASCPSETQTNADATFVFKSGVIKAVKKCLLIQDSTVTRARIQ